MKKETASGAIHRALLILRKITKGDAAQAPLTHDQKMALVWRFIEESPILQHYESEKPYTWEMTTTDGITYNLTFSSILPEITEAFLQKAKFLFEYSNCINVEKDYWQLENVMPVAALPFIGNYAHLTSSSVLCTRKVFTGNGRKRSPHVIDANKVPDQFLDSIKRRLIRRTALFSGEEVQESEVQIKYLRCAPFLNSINYKHGKHLLQNISFKLIAPPSVLQTALYGGLGCKTGSGFGYTIAD